MRKDSYHVRVYYKEFYARFGILQADGLETLIALEGGKVAQGECRELVMRLLTSNTFTNHKLEYLFGREKIFMKMSTKNFFDVMYKQKTTKINYAATLIKAAYRMSKVRKTKVLYRIKLPKLQQAVKNFLTIVKLSKKKKAVRVIEKYWIKYCRQFFMRKRRNSLMTLQRYIKRAVEIKRENSKAEGMMKIKTFVKSALQTHKHVRYVRQFMAVKELIRTDIY